MNSAITLGVQARPRRDSWREQLLACPNGTAPGGAYLVVCKAWSPVPPFLLLAKGVTVSSFSFGMRVCLVVGKVTKVGQDVRYLAPQPSQFILPTLVILTKPVNLVYCTPCTGEYTGEGVWIGSLEKG